jgi:hypothetical protein
MSFSLDHIGLSGGSSVRECVVICPLALPDAGWPESLKMLSIKAKERISVFLENRLVAITDVSDGQATQNQSASERAVASLLAVDDANRLSAFAFPAIAPPPYLAIRPVTLHAGRDHVVLKQGDAIQASATDLAELAAAISPLFEAIGLKLHTAKAEVDTRWFVSALNHSDQLHGFFDLAAGDSQQALGRNIDAYMTRGDFARQWRRLETEIQMTWFDHPVNQKLARRGLNEINSIWIEGSVTTLPKKPDWLLGLHSNRAALNQLADFWSIAHDAPLSSTALQPGHLHVFDAWQGRLTGDALAWLHSWEQLLSVITDSDEFSETTFILAGEQQYMSISAKVVAQASLINRVQQRLAFVFGKKVNHQVIFNKAMGL